MCVFVVRRVVVVAVVLAAVDVLASEVAILTQKKSREKLRRIKHELDQYRQGPDRAPIGD